MYIVFIDNKKFYCCDTLPSALKTQEQHGGKLFEEADYKVTYPSKKEEPVGSYADWM